MLLIFGGTTEGRMAVEVCEQAGKPYYYSTKSDIQHVDLHAGQRLVGAMTSDDMRCFCQQHDIRCIVDAAHPFAENLHRAIAETSLPVIRLERSFAAEKRGAVYCDSYEEAVHCLLKQPARRLLALSGANTIARLRDYWTQHPTLFRILDRDESRKVAAEQGFPIEHLIYYKEDICHTKVLPDKEQEMALMRELQCDAIITKESGETGGFESKVDAALALGIRVYVVRRPRLPQGWTYVMGRYGLRRAIEQQVPQFFPLRTGFTTGACATAAFKAALLCLLHDEQPEEVFFSLPDGEVMRIPIEQVERVEAETVAPDDTAVAPCDAVVVTGDAAMATVVKDFSDDPDVTKGCRISVRVERGAKGTGLVFQRGRGVGRVTLPGLGIPVDGPAINATPRRMMAYEMRELTDVGDFVVTVSVEGGEELAKQTFNPRVGVVDGISIIGTSGIVSPLSHEAFVQSIRRELEVARAIGSTALGMASGKKGEDALHQLEPALRVIHYGNFVGETLKAAHELGFQRVELGIMIGKAVKLAEGNLDTHSHKVTMNKDFLHGVIDELCLPDAELLHQALQGITLARELWHLMPGPFFERLTQLCLQHCRTVFPEGELNIHLLCDNPQ